MTENRLNTIISEVLKYSKRPALYEPGEPLFWNDPHISKGMLEAHLNPENDLASRKHITINKDVENLLSSGYLKEGDRVLDLGCGPGLYSSRLAVRGLRMTGIDFSERSLDYARKHAEEHRLDIDYRLMNFFDMDFSSVFDAVIQTHGEINTFSDEKRDDLLKRLRKALKPGGLFIFDSTTREDRMKNLVGSRWYVLDKGYWRSGQHLVLEKSFDYPEEDVALNQYIVLDSNGVTVYRLWFHDYSLDTIRPVLDKAGFKIIEVWNDLTGTPYQAGGDNITVVARMMR